MKYILYVVICLFFISFSSWVLAEDGTYDATVTTDSGSYSVPVEVEGGEVTYVHWPNGGNMHVYGGDISGGEADGTNSKGDSVHIEVEDYQAEDEE